MSFERGKKSRVPRYGVINEEMKKLFTRKGTSHQKNKRPTSYHMEGDDCLNLALCRAPIEDGEFSSKYGPFCRRCLDMYYNEKFGEQTI